MNPPTKIVIQGDSPNERMIEDAKTQFTPGPWFSGHLFENSEGAFYGIGNGSTAIALVRCSPMTKGAEAQANRDLITAAPTVFAALENLMSAICVNVCPDSKMGIEISDAVDRATAALAKAKGGAN